MYHILKTELGKLLKSRTFLICNILTIILTIVVLISYHTLSKTYTPELLEALSQQTTSPSGASFQVSGNLGISFFQNLSGITMVESAFAGNGIQLFLAILVSIFVCSEFSCGAIKNIASKGFSRTKIYTGKYLVCIIGGTLLAIITLLCFFLGGTVLWGVGELGVDFTSNLLTFLGVQFLLNAALTGLMVLVSMLVRNTGATIAINICIILFGQMIFSLFDLIIRSETFHVADYWIGNLIGTITSLSIPSQLFERGLMVGLLTLAISYIAGGIHFKLADI